MTIRLYFDEDSMRNALVMALRAQGIDVQTALEAQMIARTDEDHLRYSTQQGRVLCSFNRGDFYRLYTHYLTVGKFHAESSWQISSNMPSKNRCGVFLT